MLGVGILVMWKKKVIKCKHFTHINANCASHQNTEFLWFPMEGCDDPTSTEFPLWSDLILLKKEGSSGSQESYWVLLSNTEWIYSEVQGPKEIRSKGFRYFIQDSRKPSICKVVGVSE